MNETSLSSFLLKLRTFNSPRTAVFTLLIIPKPAVKPNKDT